MTQPSHRVALRDALFEIVLRVCAVLAGLIFVYNTYRAWHANPGRITLLLLLLGETANVVLLLCSRVPSKRDWSPFALIATAGATYYFLAVRLSPGIHVIPELFASGVQIAGLCVALYAKLSLRLSFGLLPANRGVVTTGAYRYTRHPMYGGYLISHIGFLLANFSLQNLFVYIGLYVFQIYRLLREEALLTQDCAYQAYRARVRFRVVPGLF